MQKKLMTWKTKGMNQDLSVSAFNPEFSFENRNLRLSTNEGNTQMSWVNERGTKKLTINGVDGANLSGIPIGTAVLNHYLIIFTTTNDGAAVNTNAKDCIFRLQFSAEDTMSCTQLYGNGKNQGNLNFSSQNPLETLVSYEAEHVQKVYWVDGRNQPRVINITPVNDGKKYKSFSFDFVPTLQLGETVTIKKQLGTAGIFAPGVIQYSFTYYNKYGQESNIFYTSPLYYISHRDRGASPEDKVVNNSFLITVEGIDKNFEFLRIYSIQRTSINATPICKRVQDIEIKKVEGTTVSFIDTGAEGDSIDPTELLYKGGESIIAKTLEQKDNTLFLGSISINRDSINKYRDSIQVAYQILGSTRKIFPTVVSEGTYIYSNQLTAYAGDVNGYNSGISVPCGGFKSRDMYRLGVQFQHNTGTWSEPFWLGDYDCENNNQGTAPSGDSNSIILNTFTGRLLNGNLVETLGKLNYIKARPLVVFPDPIDRVVSCQGVVCPTIYTSRHRGGTGVENPDNDLYAQSSWFFRTSHSNDKTIIDARGAVQPRFIGTGSYTVLPYTDRFVGNNIPSSSPAYNPESTDNNIRQVEIQGDFDGPNKFIVDKNFVTFHSPDIEFDSALSVANFSTSCVQVGQAQVDRTLSDINIQTESPTISNEGGGFVHRSFVGKGMHGIITGLFYDDYSVGDDGSSDPPSFRKNNNQRSSFKWFVFPWHKDGSLNNDVNRPANTGTPTAILKKKVISNLRFTTTSSTWSDASIKLNSAPQLFSSDENTIVKLGDKIYRGNVDTVLTPDFPDGIYFAFDGDDVTKSNKKTDFLSDNYWKTYSKNSSEPDEEGLWKFNSADNAWEMKDHEAGEGYIDLVMKRDSIRMKYKSTPHLVMDTASIKYKDNCFPIVEVNNPDNRQRFGGDNIDALRANNWVPCGEPVNIGENLHFDYGDTYFQRYDCLKTYAFTPEDKNQIVEIGSFMLESHINIDGRYDRNRGQINNLNMSPRNFNLLNLVYSQIDNFFTYKILAEDERISHQYPNQIYFTKTKQNSADVDAWTNVTLSSVLELDGDKGKITSLQRLNDQLICFQDQGISQILYNENTQISTTEGVPIEIANSGKVQGKRYLSDTVGCSNKWSICSTPMGLYFMDSISKNIFLFNGQLNNLSTSLGFNTWCKNNILLTDGWTPNNFEDFHTVYDNKNQEVLFVNKDIALAYSEKFGTFTSFYDYGGAPWLCNLDDEVLWVKGSEVWKHQAGEYCNFFPEENKPDYKPYWMTLVGNPEPQMDKVFTNLEFRACVDGDGELDPETNKFTPSLPFDYLETWNEYQHGYTALENKSGHSMFTHGDDSSALIRKFRIWRNDIPRNNCLLGTPQEGTEWPYSTDAQLGISRHIRKPQDRMRNPWLYLKLGKVDSTNKRTEVHDLVMTYYS